MTPQKISDGEETPVSAEVLEPSDNPKAKTHMSEHGPGASQWFTDAGIGYRGSDGGFGGMGGLLALLLLSRGGFTGHDGCHHKCSDINGAEAILDRLSVAERQQLVHDIRDSLGDRIRDQGDRFKDSLDCVKDKVGEVRSDVRDIAREVCDIKSETRAGFAEVRGLIRETALANELRDVNDRLAQARDEALRGHIDKRFCEEDRGCGRRRRDNDHDRDSISLRDLLAGGFRLVGPTCEPAPAGGNGH